MPASLPTDWMQSNQANLLAHLAALKERLARHAGAAGGIAPASPPGPTVGSPQGSADAAPAFAERPPALARLADAFGLSAFERDTLLLCAGMELDAELPALCAAAQGDPARPFPTFSLALAALPDAHWSALSPEAPLRYWRLIEIGAGPGLDQGAAAYRRAGAAFPVRHPPARRAPGGATGAAARSRTRQPRGLTGGGGRTGGPCLVGRSARARAAGSAALWQHRRLPAGRRRRCGPVGPARRDPARRAPARRRCRPRRLAAAVGTRSGLVRPRRAGAGLR